MYDVLKWLLPQISKLPRSHKFTLGDRITNSGLDVLMLLVEAAYTHDKLELLRQANLKLEQMRYLLKRPGVAFSEALRIHIPRNYRVFPSHRLVRKDSITRFRRRMRRLQESYGRGEVSLPHIRQSIQSWLGHVSHAKSYGLRRGLLQDIAFMKA